MILVTIGTNEQPFDRLVRAAAALGGSERLVVQYGSSREPHGRGTWIEFVPFDELAALMTEARVVVSHAGVGSIVLARECGRRPVVVPRRLHLGEAVDDHQVVLGRRLHDAGLVTLVEDEALLEPTLAVVDGAAPADTERAGPLPLAREIGAVLRTLATPA